MFAPAAPLARAVDTAKRQYRQTRRRVRDEVDVAHQLYEDATLSPQEAHQEGEPVPEEMDAEEAAEIVDDEYRPLMSDDHQQRGAKTPSRQGDDDRDAREDEEDDHQGGHAWTYRDGDGAATKARKLEVWLAQGIFFVRRRLFLSLLLPSSSLERLTPCSVQILGAAILLSWNTEIVAGSYFGERLKDSPFERSFANFVALTFTTANLLFLAWANATQAKVSSRARVLASAHPLTPYGPAGGLESPDPVESVRPDRHPVHLCHFDSVRQYQPYVRSKFASSLVVTTADQSLFRTRADSSSAS